ncbi:hypothetical protein DFJ77DRAFT_240076 [Powellomyces hirtus]|nr:hypothetical protein DFJ77DRAFT_240076 [Powellomyces hirtus]
MAEVDHLDKIMDSLQKDLSMADHHDFQGHCEKCKLPVLNDTGPGISYTVDGIQHAFHRHCFTCAGQCGNAITDGSFFMHDDKPHCKHCYENVLGYCAKCEKGLIGSQIMKAGDNKFHPACFACIKCNNELQSRYFEKDADLYCRSCYESSFVPTCSACTNKILPDSDSTKITMVEWKDKKFHQKCFACKTCHVPFTDLKALHHKDELYCQDCYFKVIKAMDEANDALKKKTAAR